MVVSINPQANITALTRITSELFEAIAKNTFLNIKNFGSKISTSKKINTASEWYKSGKLVLALGAGASASYGLPDWDTLLQKLLLMTLGKEEASKVKDSLTNESDNRAVAGLLARAFSTVFEPHALISARYLGQYFRRNYPDDSLAFEKAIRDVLYEEVITENESNLLKEIRQYCIAPGKSPNIDSIITYNYDDLLEKCIQSTGLDIPYSIIHARGMTPKSNELPIYHVHGFLPSGKPLTEGNRVVLAEDIYHKQYSDTYGWSNLVQINKFKDYNCIFIGLSFSDPNLRRLLDIAKNERGDDLIHHYCFRRHYTIESIENQLEKLLESPSDFNKIMSDLDIEKSGFAKNLAKMMEKFEETDANSFGIDIIWVDDYDEIPMHLKEIRVS